MTYDAIETSAEGAQPVEIYDFSAGSQTFRYTSAEDDVTVGLNTYLAVQGLQRDKTQDGVDRRTRDFSVKLPTSDPLAQLFNGVLPGVRVSMRVSRFHRNDLPTPEVVGIFDGFIQAIGYTNNAETATLVGRIDVGSAGKQIPRRSYSATCPHVLYDALTCKVDDTDPAFRASALSVLSMVGSTLTVVSGISGTYPDGFMNSGFVESIGFTDYRLILAQVGNVITLHQPFSAVPTSVNVFAGCLHTIQDCGSKFDNVDGGTAEGGFGGHAFVPTKNPFQTGIS